jgi:hypothetical protein
VTTMDCPTAGLLLASLVVFVVVLGKTWRPK